MDGLKQKYNNLIRSLMPISGLSSQYQNEVIQKAEVLDFKKNQRVFKQGDVDPYTFYLLDGVLELEANGQLVKTVTGGSGDAQSALAQLQPRQMSAESKGKTVLLRVPRDLMDRLLTMDDPVTSASMVEVTEVDADDDEGGGDWMTRMLQSELFSRIPPANIQRVFALMESVQFTAGSVVVEQGAPGDFYYVIQTGRCAVTRKASVSGKPIKLAELGDGDSFGEEALVSDAKRNATVTMLTDGELVRLTKDNFIELIKKPSLDSVDYEEAKALVAGGACWLDLRFPEEHAKDGVQASVNVPLNQLRTELKNLDADRIYIAYCDSGARSSAGAFLLAQNGFDVRHLEGGLIVSHGIEPTAPPPAPEPESVPEEPQALVEASEPEPKPKAESKPEPKPEPKAKVEPKPEAKAKVEPKPEAKAEAKAEVEPKSEAKAKVEPKPEAPSPAAAAALESVQADVRAAELAEDVAKADTRMQEAMRLKARAEAAKRAAAKQIQSKGKELAEKTAKAHARLEAKAAEANAALEEAKRERVELEKARREAAAEAEAKGIEEEARLEALKQEAESRLSAERANLEAEYAKQAEELAKLQELKEKAKAELNEEREALQRTASAANREVKKAEKAKSEAKAQEAKNEADEIERRVREQSEAAIRVERQRLEAEFARAAEQLAEAQSEREMAELVKDEAARKAARTIAEQKVAQELARQEEELELETERCRLKDEAKRLRKSLEDAKRVKAEAQVRAKAQAKAEAEKRKKLEAQQAKVSRDMIAAAHKVDPRSAAAKPPPQDDEVARANSLLQAAKSAHLKAEQAKQELEDTQSWKKSELEALRKQMEAELSDFMVETTPPNQDDEEEKKRTARNDKMAQMRAAEERKRAEANSLIFDDVASQLEK